MLLIFQNKKKYLLLTFQTRGSNNMSQRILAKAENQKNLKHRRNKQKSEDPKNKTKKTKK